MNEALLTEASPRSRAHRVRLRDPPDTFLLELEFDFWVLTMIWITVQFNFAWMVGQQLDGALRSSVTARCVSLVSGQALNKLILTIGVRACLQHAVRRQRLSSSRARLVIIGCLVIEALCDDLLEVWNFGLPPLSARSAPLKPVRTGSDSFLWYFYSFNHLSAGVSGWCLAARLVAFVVVVQLETVFLIRVWKNLAAGLPPLPHSEDAAFTVASYYSARVIETSMSLLFTLFLKRFRWTLANAHELQEERSLTQVMFHELRNPLTGTVGHLALAQAAFRESPASTLVAAHQADAQVCTEHALRVLHTLNALEKYSERTWPLSPRTHDLLSIVSDVATMASPSLAPGVELRHSVKWAFERHSTGGHGHLQRPGSETDRVERLMVRVDDLVLREVLLNLVQNSARFTSAGYIEFGCLVSAHAGKGGGNRDVERGSSVRRPQLRCCSFFVRDTGSGIHGDALANIFTKYSSIGGVGIGVHLSRRQVQAMGGDLVVRSPWSLDSRAGHGAGTEFFFRLDLEETSQTAALTVQPLACADDVRGEAPCAAVAHAPSLAVASPLLPAGLRVLIADDVSMNLRVLQAAFKRVAPSWRVTAVEVSGDALSLFKAARGDGDPFDLVIMDEHFDTRSASLLGTDVIRQMRLVESHHPIGGHHRASIISCSGNVEDHDAGTTEVFFSSGADDVWHKPYPSFTDGTMQRRLAGAIAKVPER
jgi:signal transduction histidine kinase/CheY-like chemotaxis protein